MLLKKKLVCEAACNRKTPCGDFLEISLRKSVSGNFENLKLDKFW
jgi:hypothetical protein